MDLSYIITGASRGIGNYLARKLIERGEVVYCCYNETMPLTHHDRYTKVNITDKQALDNWLNPIGRLEKKIVLLNCAGINLNALAHKVQPLDWSNVISINLCGTFNVINAILPYMRSNRFGRIINFSSVVPIIGVIGTTAYSASKAGLWGLTRSLCVENAEMGITANCINLGYFNIGMIDEVPEEYKKQMLSRIPNKAFGSPSDILNTVDYISSTSYLNGANIDLNGGII